MFPEGVEKGTAATERGRGGEGGAKRPNPTPASFPHLHCPQAQVCATAELQRGGRLACSSALSEGLLLNGQT